MEWSMFTAQNFTHPGRGIVRLQFESALKKRFSDDDIVTKCYQIAEIPTPFMAHHDACAQVLNAAKKLFDELQEGKFAAPVDEPDGIENAQDFFDALKSRLR
jgi:hypothetical protein